MHKKKAETKSCGDLRPCLEKVDNRPPDTFSALFGAIERKQSKTLSTGSAGQPQMEGKPGVIGKGRNVCRLKGGWLLQVTSLPKRPAMSGKAERMQSFAGKENARKGV